MVVLETHPFSQKQEKEDVGISVHRRRSDSRIRLHLPGTAANFTSAGSRNRQILLAGSSNPGTVQHLFVDAQSW